MPIVNSKEKKLSMPEVITMALGNMQKENQLPKDVPLQAAILGVTYELSATDAKHEQRGNTVFIAHFSEDGKEASVRALNVDTARNYAENTYAYAQDLSNSGVERMTSDFRGTAVLNLFKSVGRQPFAKKWGMKVIKNKDGMMRAYIVMPKG